MKTIGERLKWLRKDRANFTQEYVGNYVGVGKATIQKYEKGIITNIPSDKIMLLAEILDTTPDFIMGWTDSPSRNAKEELLNQLNRKSENGRQDIESVAVPKHIETRIVSAGMDDLPKEDREKLLAYFLEAYANNQRRNFQKGDGQQ